MCIYQRDPNNHPPMPTYEWKCPPVHIPNEAGMDDIDIVKCFKFASVSEKNMWVNDLKKRNLPPGIPLPPSIYPPYWNQRGALVHTIQVAAKDQADMMLPVSETSSKPGDQHVVLRCYRGILNTKCKKNTPEAPVTQPNGIPTASYRPNLKVDTFVNKSANTRGTEKNEGLSFCKRKDVNRPKDKSERCDFSIRINLIEGHCWYLPYRNCKYGLHINHVALPSHHLGVRTTYMTQEEKSKTEIVAQQTSGGPAQNIVTNLCQLVNGKKFVYTDQQVRYLRKKAAKVSSPSVQEEEKSNSERLVDALNAKVDKKELRYVALYHKVTNTSLLAIGKAQKVEECEKKKLREALAVEVAKGRDEGDIPLSEQNEMKKLRARDLLRVAGELSQPNHDLEMTYSCRKTPGGAADELAYMLNDIHDKLSLGKALMSVQEKLSVGDNIMIASAWCREDERLLFEKYPEVFMFDVTFGTNNEKRPLGIGAAFDGNMNTFTPLRVFMPSQCRWVFNWIFGRAMPLLFGADVLDRINLFLTDGDRTMYGAFDSVQPELYRRARHSLCMFHLVVQGVNSLKPKLKGWDTANVRNLLETFKQFLFSWMRVGEVESVEEYLESKRCLEKWLAWLKENHASEAVRHNIDILSDFLTKRILPHKDRWLACLRQDHLTLHQRTTSALEGVNQTIKHKSKNFVTPCMCMSESFQVQQNQTDSKMDKYMKEVWRQHQSYRPYAAGSPTVDKVYPRCESEIEKNVKQRFNYHVRRVDHQSIELLQMWDEADSPIFCMECNHTTTCGPCSEMSPIPRFRRIRTLTFLPLDDLGMDFQVTCSCPYYTTFGIPCRHFSVFCQVLPRHIITRHHMAYNALYKDGHAGSEDLDKFYVRMQRDFRLKITREEYDDIMAHAWQRTRPEEAYLFRAPKSLMYQRNKDGMLAFSRVATGNTMSQDSDLMAQDTYAAVDMSEDMRVPEGAVTPSPTRKESALSPFFNGAQKATKNILSLLETADELYADFPNQLNVICSSMSNFLERAIHRKKEELCSVLLKVAAGEKRKANPASSPTMPTPTSSMPRTMDLFASTDRNQKSHRLKPLYEGKSKKQRKSRATNLTVHTLTHSS